MKLPALWVLFIKQWSIDWNTNRPASTADADKDDDETHSETDDRDGHDQQNYSKCKKKQLKS